jgi:signal transduction histidine kinase
MITGALIITAIIGVALIALAVGVYIRNPNNALNRHFFLFAMAIAAWIVVNYVAANPLYPHVVQLWSNRVVLISGGLGVLWMLRFVLQLTGWWAHWRKKFRLLVYANIASWVFCLSPWVVSNVKVNNDQIVNEFGVAAFFYFATLFASTCAVLVAFVVAHYKLKGSIRSQVDVISKSILIALPMIVFGNAILPILGHYELINYTPLLVSVIVVTMAYVIVRHRLFDIRPLLARSVAYIFSLGLVSILYALGLHYITVALNSLHNGVLTNVVTISLVVIALTTYQPMRKKFDVVTNKIFYKDAYDPQDLFNTLNKAHAATLDLKNLMRSSSNVIAEYMRTQGVGVFVSDEQGVRYLNVGEFDAESQDIIKICQFAQKNEIKRLITDELDERNEKFAERLRQAGIAGIIDFGHRKNNKTEFQGYLIVGPRKSGIAFSNNDLQNLETVASELSIAIQNALHYEEIQQFNVTLQQRVDEATRKLKTTNEKLKKMDETKDEFISMASHQLRTPLTSVKGYVSMVLDGDVGPINEQQRDLLNQSFASSQRMANLISDLLNLSRINTGKFVIEPSPVHLPTIIEAELHQLREMAQGKNIELKLDIPLSFPTLMLDDNKMHQVVMNLIDNAIYYTPEGGKVTVQLTETPVAVEFRVIDTGIGVPKDAQHRLFTKMFRAENAQRARPDGTGLGLFLVKKVIVSQGGAIIFDSVEGKGSTFGFRFNKKDHEVAGTSAEQSETTLSSVAA